MKYRPEIDNNHLSAAGAARIAPTIRDAVRAALATPAKD